MEKNNQFKNYQFIDKETIGIVSQKLSKWVQTIPLKERPLLDILLLPIDHIDKLEESLIKVKIENALAQFFKFLTIDKEVKIPSWMETPEDPWPRWSEKGPWLVCYYAGPTSIEIDELFLDVLNENIIDKKIQNKFISHLTSFNSKLTNKEQIALLAIVLHCLSPIQRIGLFDTKALFSVKEIEFISRFGKKESG